MAVSVSLVKVEYDPHGTDLLTSKAPLATVYLTVKGDGLGEMPFTFKVNGFTTLDEAVTKAQAMLVDFAAHLQTAAQQKLL